MKTLITGILLTGAALAQTQTVETFEVKPGAIEVGGGYGAAFLSGSTTRATAYTRSGITINKHMTAFGELGYIPVERVNGSVLGSRISTSSAITHFAGGMQFQAPTGRLVPYGTVGFGGMRGNGSASGGGYSFSISDTTAAVNGGGGLKVYLSPNWGLDIAVKGYKPTRSGSESTFTTTVGVFYQFRNQ